MTTINKFGRALDCDANVATDIWDGADGVTSTDVWVAPTQARKHDIVSTSTDDTAAGSGMRTVRIWGLTDWESPEVSEDVTLDGTSNVETANSYVIIHRMKGLTFGAGENNAGIIKATAQTDSTITAAIQTGECQTEMAIYGVSARHVFKVYEVVARMLKGTSNVTADLRLLCMENPGDSDAGWVTKEIFPLGSTTPLHRVYPEKSPKTLEGPCIVKLQVNSDTNNAQVVGCFDGELV